MITIIQQKRQAFLKLVRSDGFKKYFTNTSWLLADNVINLAIAFVVGIFVARYLGPSNFGLLNFSKTVAKFFTVFCALGLERIVIKNLINEKDNHARILGTALGLKIIASTGCILLFAIVGYFVVTDLLTYSLILFFIVITLFEAFTVVRYYFQSKVQARFISRMLVYKIIIGSLVKFFLIYFQYPLIYFAYEALLESVIGMVGYVWVYHKKSQLNIMDWNFNKNYARQLLKDSWPLLISSFVIYIYMEIDIIMLKYMLNNEAVGYYSIAARLTTICYLGGTIICSSLFPAILNAKNKNAELYHDRFASLLRMLVAISLFISVFMFLGGKLFIVHIFGSEYAPAIPPLQILVWTIVFVYIGVAGSQWYISENLQRVLLTRTALGALFNVALNFILIPSWGINGAAIATLVSQIIASFAGNALSAKTRVLFLMQSKALIFMK